jgi:hypothetical protein
MIEDAARCIERDFPKSLLSRDPLRDRWTKQQCMEIAEAIRDLKTWLILPKSDTHEVFQAQLATMLTRVATGEWDALDRKTPDPQARAQLLHVKIQTVAASAGVWIILECLAASLRHFHIAPWPAVHWIGPLWLIVTYIQQFQPSILTSIELLKNVKGLLSEK